MKKTTQDAIEFEFKANEFDDGELSYFVNLYPAGKEADRKWEWDGGKKTPEKLITTTAMLQSGNVILDVKTYYSASAPRVSEIDLRTHKSQVNVGDAIATGTSTIYSKLGVLCSGAVSVGADPNIFYAAPYNDSPVNGIQIVGQVIKYRLAGGKTKKLDEIEVKIFVKNTSSDGCYILLAISHDAKCEQGTLMGTNPHGSDYGNTKFVHSGETVELSGAVSADRFEGEGINIPSLKELDKLKIYPFLSIYGDPHQTPEFKLEKPTLDE